MYPSYHFVKVKSGVPSAEYDPNNQHHRNTSLYEPMQTVICAAEACAAMGVSVSSSHLEIYDGQVDPKEADIMRPVRFIRSKSVEMRTLAAEWQQKLPMYEAAVAKIIEIPESKPAVTQTTDPLSKMVKRWKSLMSDLEWAERDLAIWQNMGHGLPSDQRQCYKPSRPIAVAALQAVDGNIDDAFVVLAMTERKLRTRF